MCACKKKANSDHPASIFAMAGSTSKSHRWNFISCKVERILEGSLDLILSPSPLVKIQIMGGKVCLRCKGKTMLGIVNKLLTRSKWDPLLK